MAFISTYHSNYLHRTRVTLDNLRENPLIKKRLVDFGYDDTRLEKGAALHTEAQELFRLYLEKRQERAALSKQLKAKFREVFTEYVGHIKRLRKELKNDPPAAAELALPGKRERSIAGFIEQATHFYHIAGSNSDIFGKLQAFGFTAEKLKAGMSGVAAYRELRSRYDQVNGECQRLVAERNMALQKLREWMAALVASCKIAFRDNLQALEEIGILIRNRPRSTPAKPDTDIPPGTAPLR